MRTWILGAAVLTLAALVAAGRTGASARDGREAAAPARARSARIVHPSVRSPSSRSLADVASRREAPRHREAGVGSDLDVTARIDQPDAEVVDAPTLRAVAGRDLLAEIEVISRFESAYRRSVDAGRTVIPPDETMFTSDLEGISFSSGTPIDNVYVVEGLHGTVEDTARDVEDEATGAGADEVRPLPADAAEGPRMAVSNCGPVVVNTLDKIPLAAPAAVEVDVAPAIERTIRDASEISEDGQAEGAGRESD